MVVAVPSLLMMRRSTADTIVKPVNIVSRIRSSFDIGFNGLRRTGKLVYLKGIANSGKGEYLEGGNIILLTGLIVEVGVARKEEVFK